MTTPEAPSALPLDEEPPADRPSLIRGSRSTHLFRNGADS